MLQIDLRRVVNQIVQHELYSLGKEDLALYVNFDVRMSHYMPFSGKPYNQSRGLHLLYYVKPGHSYVTVFSGVTSSPFGSINDVVAWKHECTHDSCWRDIDIFSTMYFEMAEKINLLLVENNFEEIPPKDMNEFSAFRGNQLFNWIPVNVTKDSQDVYNYNRILKLI